MELYGTISDGSASNGISVNGAGDSVLDGTNTYSGNTSVNQGTLQLGSNSAIPSGAGKGNVIVASGAVLDVHAQNAVINGLSGSGTIDNLSGGSATLNLGNNNARSTFSGILQNTSGILNIVKSGSGILTLNGFSSYSGTTTINGGTLLAGAADVLSPLSAMSLVSGTLDVSGYPNMVQSLSVGSGGTLDLGIGNVLTSLGTASLGGTLNISGTANGSLIVLLSYSSETGTFASVVGLPAGYTLQYNHPIADQMTLESRRFGARRRQRRWQGGRHGPQHRVVELRHDVQRHLGHGRLQRRWGRQRHGPQHRAVELRLRAPSVTAATPEPSTLALLGIGAISLLRLRLATAQLSLSSTISRFAVNNLDPRSDNRRS